MGLTSTKLQLLFSLLAVVAVVATVWWWPRLGGRSWRAVGGRVGVLVANQALTLVALGLALNAWGGFYGSWDDLLGTGAAAAGAPIIAAGGTGAAVKVLDSRAVKAGRIEQVLIPGATTGITAPAYVFLPTAYFTKKPERFPVILALTGYPGDARNLMTRMDLPGRMARAIAAHEAQPTVLVMMRPSVAPPRDTECIDVPGGPQVETYFTKDVKQSMSASFRVGSSTADWGILGGSTGGFCALKMAMRQPSAYTAAVSLSGYFRTILDSTTGDLFGGRKELEQQNDLMWRLAHLPAPPVNVLVTSSKVGESDYGATLRFLAAVKPPMQASSLILPSGGHNFDTWNRELPQALPWLAQQLRSSRPTQTPDAAPRPQPPADHPHS